MIIITNRAEAPVQYKHHFRALANFAMILLFSCLLCSPFRMKKIWAISIKPSAIIPFMPGKLRMSGATATGIERKYIEWNRTLKEPLAMLRRVILRKNYKNHAPKLQ